MFVEQACCIYAHRHINIMPIDLKPQKLNGYTCTYLSYRVFAVMNLQGDMTGTATSQSNDACVTQPIGRIRPVMFTQFAA